MLRKRLIEAAIALALLAGIVYDSQVPEDFTDEGVGCVLDCLDSALGHIYSGRGVARA